MKDLAPTIFRQRLIIEATLNANTNKQSIDEYLKNLSDLLDMTIVMDPLTRENPKYGFSSYVYWEESGTHLYHWHKPYPFLSVDIYTCKQFDVDTAVTFTKDFFGAKEIVFKSV